MAAFWPLISGFSTPELLGEAQVSVRPPPGEACCAFSGRPDFLRFSTSRSRFAPDGVRLEASFKVAPERGATLSADLNLVTVPPQGSTSFAFPVTTGATLSYAEEEGGALAFLSGSVFGRVALTPTAQPSGGYRFDGLAEVTTTGTRGGPGDSREVLVSFWFAVPPNETWGFAGAAGVGVDEGGCGGDVDPGEDYGEGCGRGEGYDSEEGGCGGDDYDGSRSDCEGSGSSEGDSADCGGSGDSGPSDSHCGLVSSRGRPPCSEEPTLGSSCKKRRTRTPLRMVPYAAVFLGIAFLRRRVRAVPGRPR